MASLRYVINILFNGEMWKFGWTGVRPPQPKAQPEPAAEPPVQLPKKRVRRSSQDILMASRLDEIEARLQQPNPEVVRLRAELERTLEQICIS